MGSRFGVQCPQLSVGVKEELLICLWRGLASAGTVLFTGEGQPPVWSNKTAGVKPVQEVERGHIKATVTQFI